MQSKSTQESWLCQSSNGDLLFGYDQMHKTHQPRTMYDPNNGTMDLYWDANGNLAQVINVNFLKPIYPPQNISIKEWNGH